MMEDLKLTKKELGQFEAEVSNDLVAVFMAIQFEIQELLEQSEKEGWPSEKFIHEVDKLLGVKNDEDSSIAR